MNQLLTKNWETITNFKAHTSKVISESKGKEFALLNREKVVGYLVPQERLEELLEAEYELSIRPEIQERLNDEETFIKGTPEDLFT